MEKSTEDQSPTYKQMTFEDSRNAIFSPESEAGHLLCNSQAGTRIDQPGQDLVHASHSVKRASKKRKPTKGTSGQKCSGSSASVSLTQCLASRLRQRLDMVGLMEFKATWKEKVTPSRIVYSEQVLSARRTSEADCTGLPSAEISQWGTPRTNDGTTAQSTTIEPNGTDSRLELEVLTSPWATPTVTDEKRGSLPARPQDTGVPLTQMVATVPWGTPAARDWKDGHQQDVPANGLLGRQVWQTDLVPWATPMAADDGHKVTRASKQPGLIGQCHLGATSELSNAQTVRKGVLEPEFSRWLMGFPATWDKASPNYQDWLNVQERIASEG
jgi:hypothetical protein